jgi:outer membrane protein
MKKGASMHVRWLVTGFALAVFAAGIASSGARAADLRVGVVDVRKAVFSSSEGKTAQQQFSKLEDEKMAELRPRQEEVRRLEEEYEKQKFVLSPDALQDRRLEIVKRRRDLERDFNEAQDDLQIRQVQLLQPIQKKIAAVVEDVGKAEGFTLILDKQAAGFLYFDDSIDVTDLVIKRLNE